MTDLFAPATLGDLSLQNRLVMAPLTRMRSDSAGVPGDLVVEHYAQRATLGLIVTEGTFPSPAGRGYSGQPGLVTADQAAGWARVTEAVHSEGGRIVAQLMHAGRVTHGATNGGLDVEAPSAIAIDGETYTPEGKLPYPVPVALDAEALERVVRDFVSAARLAVDAGFDGVEVHGANGYLLHEFLAPSSNVREDRYGGSPENRARFVAEVVEAVSAEIGAARVGLRISPSHNIQDVLETDPADVSATYGSLLARIAPLGLAYLSILHDAPAGDLVQSLRDVFGGPVLLNSGFGVVTTRDEAVALVADGVADAVVVGRPAIANPDLVRRWREGLPLNELDASTLYTPGAAGYTDYPALAE
ncbi:alkene reductase [Marisediminicola sp. LYQ134]|uniref:alkene reductase n=1 Tax=unclassified Marisediminicola TaxID=2618316 RepID=UPI0039837641